MSKKINSLITDLFEDVEFTEPAQAFKDAGHQVITIDIQAGKDITGKKGEAVKIDKGIGLILKTLMLYSSLADSLLIYYVKTTVLVNSQKHLYKKVNLFLPFAMALKY
ncbi:hypothetical protein BFRIPA_00048 (plasmid) [Peribacillus frigoritolerans]